MPPAPRWWWRQPDEGLARVAGTAVLVAVAYYVGARLGFLLQSPSVPTSVLWPPNAILTATLLLTPVRRWWIWVLAVIPAHLCVQVGVVHPPSLIAALFVTNWSEAVIAAVGVRLFSDAPARFDTLRRMAIFIVAAGLVAPFVSSFVDAAAVTALRGGDYSVIWRTRFFSNVLTELTLASVIVMALDSGRQWLTAAHERRSESAVLASVLFAVGLIIFGADGPWIPADLPRSTLALLLLPVLLWAAVKFGPASASLSLLLVTALATWGAHHGRGPFATLPAADRVIALQISLIMVAIPLLCLAAVVGERRRAQTALNDRLQFEALLARLSSTFVRLTAEEIDAAIRSCLAQLGEFFDFQRVALFRLSDADEFSEWHAWQGAASAFAPGPSPPLSFEVPLLARGHRLGKLAIETGTAPPLRSDGWISRVTMIADILGSALAKKEAEDAVRASESMKSAILASLTTRVAVLDRAGRIIEVNEAWKRHASEPGVDSPTMIGIDADYLACWRRASREGDAYAEAVAEGIGEVLGGVCLAFSVEFPCRSNGHERWWALSVVPLSRPEGGAVVSQAEVTERRNTEIDAQRMRQELAHFTRTSTMGELTASLAHELNQPLTAILANAQAARRSLDAGLTDVEELRAILSDIVDDDRRAGEVIHRLRDMMVKREPESLPLDLNLLLVDVIKLLTSDLLIHNITIVTELTADLPLVQGDRVQLQQVVLNLLLNAIDATGDGANKDRTITVRTEWLDSVHVSVSDEGHGLGSGTHDLVFQPFFTTKPTGMGMGLAVARSIIEAHGGLIWATDNPTRGATFHFAVPAQQSSSRA